MTQINISLPTFFIENQVVNSQAVKFIFQKQFPSFKIKNVYWTNLNKNKQNHNKCIVQLENNSYCFEELLKSHLKCQSLKKSIEFIKQDLDVLIEKYDQLIKENKKLRDNSTITNKKLQIINKNLNIKEEKKCLQISLETDVKKIQNQKLQDQNHPLQKVDPINQNLQPQIINRSSLSAQNQTHQEKTNQSHSHSQKQKRKIVQQNVMSMSLEINSKNNQSQTQQKHMQKQKEASQENCNIYSQSTYIKQIKDFQLAVSNLTRQNIQLKNTIIFYESRLEMVTQYLKELQKSQAEKAKQSQKKK